MMPKIEICTQLPFKLILGFVWQQQVQARCTYASNGSLCISTPTSFYFYECIHASKHSINCVAFHQPSLDDVSFPEATPNAVSSETKLIRKYAGLSTIQQAQLDAVIEKITDVFYSNDDNIGLCQYIEFKIELQHERPITSPAFIVEQPFHESTSRRVVVDFSRTISPITKIHPQPIDQMEEVIQCTAGKRYNSKRDVKYAFNCISISEADIYKTGFDTPDGHYEFLRIPFGVTNGPSTMTRAIKLAYDHLVPYNVNTYIDDISTSHDDFNYSVRPDAKRIAAIEPYLTLKSIQKVLSFLGFANQFRKYIRNYAVIAKPLTSVLKGLEKKTSNTSIVLTDDQQRTFEPLKTAITTANIISHFKQGLTTILETDASYSELDAVLSQEQNGKRRVIEYASRTSKYAETYYHSNELECTAVHCPLTEKCQLYLLSDMFRLITDNYTTAYVVSKSAINRKFAQYLVDLAQFDFTTEHRPGKQNVIADHLPRFPTPPVCLTVTASYESETCVKQKRDGFCQYIFRLLKEKNPNKKTMPIICNYNIDNNTLVRVKDSKTCNGDS
ncbi:retrovirus-related Pol polyprotein from transposon opus [Trichonephila clavipes]|nr:retrovirus-related Pol polyprotein from transposon opus [Trichonephila clavipes]